MPAIFQNFDMYQGDDTSIDVTLVNAAGAPVSLVGVTIKWALSRSVSEPALLTKQTGSGVVVTDAVGGSFSVVLVPADTQSMVGTYYHEVELTDAAGKRLTVLTGKVIIAPTLII